MKMSRKMKINAVAVMTITATLFTVSANAGILDNVTADEKQDLKITALLEQADQLDYNMSIHQAQEILGDADVKLKFFPTEEKDTFIWENKTSLFNKEYLLVLFEDYQLHSIHYHDGKNVNINYGSRKDAKDIIREAGDYSLSGHIEIPPIMPVPGIPAMMDRSFFYYKMIDLKDDMSDVVKVLGAPSEITPGPEINYIWKFEGTQITVLVKDGKVGNKRIKSSQYDEFMEIESLMDDSGAAITTINMDKLK
ncbi:MAG: hypothetical protein H8E46_11645 [FCB group bacterium]|nr:hypothetical protein [FCB group bacterium]